MDNYCIFCDYVVSDNYKFQRHNETLKHTNKVTNFKATINTLKTAKKNIDRDILIKQYILTLENKNKTSIEKYKDFEQKLTQITNENDGLKNENFALKHENNELKNKIQLLEINLAQEKCKILEKMLLKKNETDQKLEKILLKNNKEKNKILEKMLLEKDEKDQKLEKMLLEKDEKDQKLEKILLENNKEKDKLLDKLITQKTANDNKQCTVNILNNWNCNVEPLQNLDFFDILDKHTLKTTKINPNNLPTKKCLGYECDGNCDKKYICPSKYILQKKIINQWLKTKEISSCSDYISGALINYYSENTDKNLLPIINTDSSRNNYYLRIKDNETNEDKWISDKKGKKLTEMVIKPFIEYIIVLLNDYDDHLTNNMISNATSLVSNLVLHFENELVKLKQDKPTSKKLLIEYKRQKAVYLEYINIFKNYESNDALMKDIGYILDICVEHCRTLHAKYDRNNTIITSGKTLVSDIIKCLNKTAFINTILSKISPHFYKSHNNILEIIK